jgi:hypothetical protein
MKIRNTVVCAALMGTAAAASAADSDMAAMKQQM